MRSSAVASGANAGSIRAFCSTARQNALSNDDMEKYFAEYYKSDRAYTNIPVDEISFETQMDFRNNPVPELRYKGQKNASVLTPWAAVIFANCSYKGNIGSKMYNSDQVVSDPLSASQKLVLGMNGFTEEDSTMPSNKHFNGYLQWTQAIRAKMINHIVENLSDYPKLRLKYKAWEGRADILHDMVEAGATNCVRYKRNPEGEDILDSAFTQMEKKMFYTPKSKTNSTFIFPSEFDEDIYHKQGGVRLNLPIYDVNGEQMDYFSSISRSDIVAAEVLISSSMYETFYGIKQTLKSITLLQKAKLSAPKRARSPFGDLSLL
eukprot:CFRG1055T1